MTTFYERHINDYFNKKRFFNQPYEELNKVSIPSSEEIHKYQISKLQAFYNAFNKNNRYKELNELFTNSEINTLPEWQQSDMNKQLDNVITEIIETIGEFRNLTKFSKTGDDPQRFQKAQNSLQHLYSILSILKTELGIKSYVFEKDLQLLQRTIEKNSLRSFGQTEMKQWISNLNQIQGELVEEIGVAWLRKRIPEDMEISVVSSGKIYYSGGSYGSAGQLIQDILMLNISNVDILNETMISYKIDGKNYNTTLKQFLNTIQNSNGDKAIKIDDSVYEILLSLSELNIQSKSGLKQLPWNNNQRTAFTIGDMSTAVYNGISIARIFELLNSLALDKKYDWIKNTSNEDYNALVNYGIATVFNKILHLSERGGNQYLLTPSGFITYTERLEQLLKENNSIVQVKGNVSVLKGGTLSQKYQATIPWYSR